MEKVMEEEYNIQYSRIRDHLAYIRHPECNNKDFIDSRVRYHFSMFLNNYEREYVKQLILENYNETFGYISGINLPNGNTIDWEIELVVSSAKTKCINEHMNKYYSQEYKDKFYNIIQSKKI